VFERYINLLLTMALTGKRLHVERQTDTKTSFEFVQFASRYCRLLMFYMFIICQFCFVTSLQFAYALRTKCFNALDIVYFFAHKR